MDNLDLTAVVLSSSPAPKIDTKGINALVYTNVFDRQHLVSDLHSYRKKSVWLPTTKYMCWVDDDDELPDDIVGVCTRLIQLMEQEGTSIGYTDEVLNYNGRCILEKKQPYSRTRYEAHPYMVMHHLVVMDVRAAQEADGFIPEGLHWTEYLFNIYMAELGMGASYLPEVGYIWNRKDVPNKIHMDLSGVTAHERSREWARHWLPSRM